MLSALFTAGCSREVTGELGHDQMFMPAFNQARARLVLDIGRQGLKGGLKIFFLDFAGQVVRVWDINFPSGKKSWSWDLGQGAKVKGRKFYALRIVRLGRTGPAVRYRFLPLGAPEKIHRGGSFQQF